MDGLNVRRLMTAPVVSLNANDDITVADAVMRLQHVRHLPVVTSRETLVGLVTHRDLLAAQTSSTVPLNAHERVSLAQRIKVASIMRTEVTTVTPEAPLRDAAIQLRENRYGCLPVVENEVLVGILTEADFLSLVVDILDNLDATAG